MAGFKNVFEVESPLIDMMMMMGIQHANFNLPEVVTAVTLRLPCN